MDGASVLQKLVQGTCICLARSTCMSSLHEDCIILRFSLFPTVN